jgi:hypothetical protein
MSPRFLRWFFFVASLLIAGQLGMHAAEPAIIAKARAYLGGDKALDAVQSIHYTGKITYDDGMVGAIELIFQKPYRQRVSITTEKRIEVSALDNYDAWTRVQDPKDTTRWQLRLLSPAEIKALRAATAEQLNFFRSVGPRSGSIEDLGEAKADDQVCRKLSFKRDDGSVFVRYFDPATGKLVLSESPTQGYKMRETGELFAGGVRFPQRFTQTTKLADGKERAVTIDFEKVTVNETFADSLFTVPSVSNR